MEHELKCALPYFEDVWWVRKTFEIRYDDRNYQAGDTLLLRDERNIRRTMATGSYEVCVSSFTISTAAKRRFRRDEYNDTE